MEHLPFYVYFVFGMATLFCVWLFYKASGNSKITLAVLIAWLALHAILGLSGFYKETSGMPPRFALLVFPPILIIIGLFCTAKGKM